MKVLITGGTGFVGAALVPALAAAGMDSLVLSRGRRGIPGPGSTGYDRDGLIPADILAGAGAVVNLAGETIFQPWTAASRKRILGSRLDTTGRLIASLRRNRSQGLAVPVTLVSASAIGYYGPRPVGEVGEDAPAGGGFLASVCRQWEAATGEAGQEGVRTVILRCGVVLGAGGGMLALLERLYRLYMGGVIGDGRQHMSWVHRRDLVEVIRSALTESSWRGAYNLTAPEPVTMGGFANLLGRALGRPAWTRLPAFIARLFLGAMADELLLADQRVLPRRLLAAGYPFAYPTPAEALAAIYAPPDGR